MIVGHPGCGKTALMNSVARCLSQTGYVTKNICRFSEIYPPMCQESKTLYVLDDAFGIFNYNVSFTGVLDHYKNIDVLLKYKHSKLLMTCRTSVYKKIETFNFSAVVEVIDLSDPRLSMDHMEKSKFLKNLCHSNMPANDDWMNFESKHHCFPLLCVLYADFVHLREEKTVNLFCNPNETFLHFLDHLQESKTLTYICLVWVVLHGRAQCPLIAQNEKSKELEMALMSCDKNVNETNLIKDLTKEFERLIRGSCWLQVNADVCSFRHTLVFEMVAYHYGKSHTKNLLDALPCNIIGEIFFVDNNTDEECIKELCIPVDNDTLTERLLAGIENKEFLDVFTNDCWKCQNFCDAFRKSLQNKSVTTIRTLFWEEKSETACKYKYEIQGSENMSLKNDDFEWYRQKLLEERIENISNDGFYFDKKVKGISWVFGYGINDLLEDLVKITDDIKSMTVSEQIRFLILAIFSKNIDCFDIALEFVNGEDLNKTCVFKTENEKDKPYFNKHKKFTPLTAACYRGFSAAIEKLVEKGSKINLKDENGNVPFVLACRFGNIDDCLYLKKCGANINCSCGKGMTPLIAAVINNNKELVKFLIKENVDVNQCTADNKSPLYYAVKCSKDVEIVKILTASKADVNKVGRNGKSPLYWAAQNGSFEIAKHLITERANINECDKKKKTPLYCASKRGYHDIVKLLLENKADVNIPTSQNRTPLYRATKRGHFRIDETLIKQHANVDKMDNEGYTPLYWASKRGHVEIVKLLLKNKASPNSKTDDGKTALHCAALAGHADIIRLLVQNNAEVNLRDVRERTALYLASKRGHLNVVNFLIEQGSDINAATEKGKTAVFGASKNNHIDVLKSLICKKANVDHSNKKEQSPLYSAAKRGHLEVVEILLNANADVNKICINKQTALYWASQGGYYSIAKVLLEHGADLNQKDNDDVSPLYCASKRGYLNIVRLLVENDAKVNSLNINHQTPLFCACKGNQMQIAEYLIKQNADVNLRNNFGETPLFLAAENGHIYIVKLLCKNSCNVNEYNNEQKTPLFFAAKNGHSEIVKYLLDVGAKSNISDKYGRLPITMADRNDHMDTVKILRQAFNP